FAARAVLAQLLGVCELAAPLENGTHFPLFLLCLQQAARLKDQDWLTLTFQQSKVNMLKTVRDTHRHRHTHTHTHTQTQTHTNTHTHTHTHTQTQTHTNT